MSITIAYLAPEIPALSATFVYEELLAMERRGYRVLPFTVHVPKSRAKGQEALAARCITLYDSSKLRVASDGLTHLFSMPGLAQAVSWLIHDMRTVGPNKAVLKLCFQFLAAAKLAHVLLRDRAKHLHIHFAHVPTQIGMYAAAFAQVPFTVTAHANDIFERGLLLKEKAERAKKIVTISGHNVTYLESLGLPANKLGVVRCGVSFPPPSVWPLAQNRTVHRIGTLGRLVEKKGVDDLIDAISRLPDVQLSVAGDGPLLPDLRAKVATLGLQSSVEFVGSLNHSQVAGWLAKLDVFVLACKRDANGDMDGIPVVLMEAMSQGVPVVSTRLSGIPELVLDGVTGLLAQPSDSADLSQKIHTLIQSAELRNKLSLAAVKHVNHEFSQLLNISRLEDVFGLSSKTKCGT